MAGKVVSYGQFGDILPGPQSQPVSNTGTDWLDARTDAGAIDAAFSADHRQKLQRELGGVAWDRGTPDTQPRFEGQKFAGQSGERRSLATPPSGVKEQGGLNWRVRDASAPGEIIGGPPDRTEPVQHVYRGMSEDEFSLSQSRGFIKSDGRGAIEPEWEGTNAAVSPATAYHYMPRDKPGRIVKMEVNTDDQWFTSSHDDYARTRAEIPMSRVVASTSPFSYNDSGVPSVRDAVVADQKKREGR